ncbi:MAG: TetR/AcrR family transcriptional regulator [Candidatus Neomarinimicrobiota bacterium]|nr:MAG: TetR/AcrR family transcriptional regulator [Candidatus Neomarinimicrobiota bacterium]
MNRKGSTTSLPATADKLKQAGWELFRRFGWRKVTVEDISRQAGVSKVTFYKYYQNKQDLLQSLLKDELEWSRQRFRSIMESPLPFREKVQQMLVEKNKSSARFGEQLLQDLATGDPSIYQQLVEMSREFQQEILAAFAAEQQQGRIRPSLSMELLEYLMNRFQDMYRDPDLQRLYSDKATLIAELTEFLFYGISPPVRN